jgi:sodium transport system ATP-binding protein
LIEVQNLVKTFHDRKKGEIPAVKGVSFTCPSGKIFGLLGRNGAGKTTTLRMLATILQPTSGTARINGHDIRERPAEVRRSIGYLSGDTKLYDRLTGRDLLQYFGALAGMHGDRIAKRMEELRQTFQLDELLDKRVGKMSTGMKQRLSIARVLFHEPQVLILDEPTAGLDTVAARRLIDLIGDMGKRGLTVIFSTHIMTEAERICDEIAIIDRGQILDRGTVDALCHRNGSGAGKSLEDVFIHAVEEVSVER